MLADKRLSLRFAFLLALFAGSAGVARAADDDGFCRNGGFPIENASFSEAFVLGPDKVWFNGDMNGCPQAGPQCRTKSYVVAHDRLVLGRRQGRFACAFFPNRGGGTAGWIEAARLKPIAANPQPMLSAWLGEWADNGNPRVRFAWRSGALVVNGDAYWPTRRLDQETAREHPGWPHTGDIKGVVGVDGNHAHHQECNVTFTLLNDFMIAADPDVQCGGMNVSFSGVYQRVKG